MFKQCDIYQHQLFLEDISSFFLHTCYSCNFYNITFLEYGFIANNLIGKSLLKNIKINVSTIMQNSNFLKYLVLLEYRKMYQRNFTDISVVEINDMLIIGNGMGGIQTAIFHNYEVHLVVSNSRFITMNKQVLLFVNDGGMLAKFWIKNCMFLLNSYSLPDYNLGQGAMIQVIFYTNHGTIIFNNCTFQFNDYWESLISVNMNLNTCLLPTNVIIRDCKFKTNSSPLLYFYSTRGLKCILTLIIEGPISIMNNLNINSQFNTHNTLYIQNTIVNIHGPVIISHNLVDNNYVL